MCQLAFSSLQRTKRRSVGTDNDDQEQQQYPLVVVSDAERCAWLHFVQNM